MDETIRRRCIEIGEYMLSSRATVRQAAQAFGISKSSVHKDMVCRLIQADPAMAAKVASLMEYNKSVCHLRGGEATRRRYQREREAKQALHSSS